MLQSYDMIDNLNDNAVLNKEVCLQDHRVAIHLRQTFWKDEKFTKLTRYLKYIYKKDYLRFNKSLL